MKKHLMQICTAALSCSMLMFSANCQAASYPMSEVARHNTAQSCWMVIEGKVYDVTAYLPEHKTDYSYDLQKWCGRDSTSAWKTKDGRHEEHKRKAVLLLQKYLIGDLAS